VSIGLAEVTIESTSISQLLHAADSACYIAKKQGRHVQEYSVREQAEAGRRGEIQWLQAWQSALQEDRLELTVQPTAHAGSQVTGGPELQVWLRLKDEAGMSIAPEEFKRTAERCRLISHVDRWVVETSLTLLARGAIRLAPDRSLCINLSGQTLGDSSFVEFVVACLARTGVAPQRVFFAVSVGSLSSDDGSAQHTIEDLRKRGIGIETSHAVVP
jgi:EAL domain-containing protein (putative c-di-GMP-specific phosphodiesterase class I)